MISDFKECKFLIDYVENYCPNLLTWKEFADLINIRPLLTQERVKLLDPKKRIFKWYTHGWMKDVNTYPPSLIRALLDEIVIYFSDMSRSTKNINDFASFLEDQYERHALAHKHQHTARKSHRLSQIRTNYIRKPKGGQL